MTRAMKDPNLWDIDAALFLKLQYALDENSTWKDLLSVVPSEYSGNVLQHINIEGNKRDSSPAKVLLFYLGDKGVRVSLLTKWLESVGLEKVLLLIKDEEPLKIIEHPSPVVTVEEYGQLKLTCKATSFPRPDYQWFKEDEELLLQQEADLVLNNVCLKDSGTYICRVVSSNPNNGNVQWDFCRPSKVTVVPQYNLIERMKRKCIANNALKHTESNDFSKAILDMESKWKCHDQQNEGYIEIWRDPVSPGKIARGSSIVLTCEAFCDFPVSYQWLCDGREIPGATSPHLNLENIFPDPKTGAIKWDYQCKVFHNFSSVLSKSISVELLPSDENTQYFAEEKIALLIANDEYENLEKLVSPPNDVVTLATIFAEMGFKVLSFRNLTLQQMKNVFEIFCRLLRSGVYAVVYFAGHGFELYKQQFLQPVDCHSKPDPEESLYLDYILQSMQLKDPALIVLLLDTCRNAPFKKGDLISPRKFYEPKTKGNTVFGYATSSLCSSHECDSEPNSFFVKYLIKYLRQKIKIQDVLYKVQNEFQTDPLARHIQYPFVGSSLFESRSLQDKVRRQEESVFDTVLSWANISNPVFEDRHYLVKQLDVTIVLTFRYHKEFFINGMDVKVYLDIGEKAHLPLISQMEFDVQFLSDEVNRLLRRLDCSTNNKISSSCLQVSYEIPRLQDTKESLDGTLFMKHRQTGKILLRESFSLGPHHIVQLNLNKNCYEPHLDSYNKLEKE